MNPKQGSYFSLFVEDHLHARRQALVRLELLQDSVVVLLLVRHLRRASSELLHELLPTSSQD